MISTSAFTGFIKYFLSKYSAAIHHPHDNFCLSYFSCTIKFNHFLSGKLLASIHASRMPGNLLQYTLLSHLAFRILLTTQAAKAYKYMSPWQHNRRDPPIKLRLLLKPSKGHHIHNDLGLPIAEDIPQSQFVGLCEMNTLQ